MIAPAEPVRRQTTAAWKTFLALLPAITCHASIAFGHKHGDDRDDLIQEVVANAAMAFMRLVQLDGPRVGVGTLRRYAGP
jgi:hypothetical protein